MQEQGVMDYVQNKDFVEFSKAIKKELLQRVNSDSFVKSRADDVKRYINTETIYKSISGKSEE